MKKNCVLYFLLISMGLFAQTPTTKGYIMEIEGSSVYLDYNASEVTVGERVQVVSDSKTMIHPITKEKIVKSGELIATLEITEVKSNYSVAGKIFPANALAQLKVGNKVLKIDKTQSTEILKEGKSTVAIAAATINDVVGPGYFGTYVSDMLMAELLNCSKIKLIDRSLLNAQLDETNLKEAGYIRADQAIMKGQISGIQYMIQVIMQKPDVTNVSTGIPIQSIVSAASAVAQIAGAPSGLADGLIIGSKVTSNVKTARLKSAVSITARVVDVQTGEVLFLCSGTGTSEGEGQTELEGGALGGMQINGGIEGFRQTVTGKAIALAYRKIGNSLRSFFDGTTTEKVISNNVLYTDLTLRKGKIYQGVNKLTEKEIKSLYEDTPERFFEYKSGLKKQGWGRFLIGGLGIPSFLVLLGTNFFDDNVIFVRAISLLGGTVGIIAGIKQKKQGALQIKNGVEAHNKKLRQSQLTPEYNIGLSFGGLALTINF